eukprot:scaffold6591_cov106-Cylindrotheca_fusiformis.AAC.7
MLCGIHMDEASTESLRDLLNEIEWKLVSFSQCTGTGIQSLSSPSLHIKTIRIRQCNITSNDFTALGSHIQNSTSLKELELFEEDFSSDDTKALHFSAGLADSKSLRQILLSYCCFDETAISNISNGLARNRYLELLFIIAGELEDEQVGELLQSVTTHPCLREVNISRNYCKTDGIRALSAVLSPSASCSLKSLDLSHQHTERANKLDISLLAPALATNTTLTNLNLSFNRLNDTDVESIAGSLVRNQTLEELDLRANKIGIVGEQAIAEYLRTQPRLRKLFLFGNPLGEKGDAALLDAIAGNSTLEVLNLGYTSPYYHEIQFYACLNQAGRRLFKQSINPALWSLVLERTASVSKKSRGACTTADLIFNLLLHGSAPIG